LASSLPGYSKSYIDLSGFLITFFVCSSVYISESHAIYRRQTPMHASHPLMKIAMHVLLNIVFIKACLYNLCARTML
jgi:hypothetical protein